MQVECRHTMEASPVKFGELVSLRDFDSSSPLYKDGSSLRITGKMDEYCVESSTARVIDGGTKLWINTENLGDLALRVGSTYQFIGELSLPPNDEAILDARIGRNVNGIDMEMYCQSLLLLKKFQNNFHFT